MRSTTIIEHYIGNHIYGLKQKIIEMQQILANSDDLY